MKYTINDLAAGKCAVINDGTLNQLRDVLIKAFPADPINIDGVSKYYYTDGNSGRWWSDRNRTHLAAQSVKDFLKEERILENRFPFKLSEEQGKRIIANVCNDWKNKLLDKWAKEFVLHGYVDVDEGFYKEGRKAINGATNRDTLNNILDDIFGKDEPEPVYKVGDYIIVVSNSRYPGLNGTVGQTYHITEVRGKCLYFEEDNSIDTSVVEVRYATEAEIKEFIELKEFNRYKYADGDPVWVKNFKNENWNFRYTTGKIIGDNVLQCYANQEKSGPTFNTWVNHKPAPGVEPPKD